MGRKLRLFCLFCLMPVTYRLTVHDCLLEVGISVIVSAMWAILASWITVAAVVPVLIGIGVGVMSMNPPEYSVAQVSFTLAALILLGRAGWWIAFEKGDGYSPFQLYLFTFFVFGIVGTLWVVSVSWVSSKQQPSAKPQTDSFSVGVRSAMIYDGAGPLSLYMVGYKSMYGQTASPVFYLVHIQIVNLQNVPSTIEGYSVAVSDNPNGPWENLLPISLLSSSLYALGIASSGGGGTIAVPRGAYRLATPMQPNDMKHAALLNPHPKLESELGNPMQPHQTISGWAAFDLQDRNSRTVRNYFRIAVRDSTNVSFTEIVSLPRRQQQNPETDTQTGLIDVTGLMLDISSFHVRYYGDPYPKR